jgi:hypothetical protein
MGLRRFKPHHDSAKVPGKALPFRDWHSPPVLVEGAC